MPVTWNKGPTSNLEQELEEAKKTKDWVIAIIHSAIELEKFGYIAIREYLEAKKVETKVSDKLLERINLREIADYLLLMEVMDKQEYKTVQKIGEERNKFVHRKPGSDYFMEQEQTRNMNLLLSCNPEFERETQCREDSGVSILSQRRTDQKGKFNAGDFATSSVSIQNL